MQRLRLYQVDAFTSRLFGGNPAAVVPLDRWLDDATMQAISLENNLSETAFFVPEGDGFRLRWFTPTVEVDLCGHATLASAFVLFTELSPVVARCVRDAQRLLTVRMAGDRLVMDFPRWSVEPLASVPAQLTRALNAAPREISTVNGSHDNLFVVFDTEAEVRALAPDFTALRALKAGVIATAPGEQSDCVVRYFASAFGIDEDPATGSIHCALTPYWAERLGKSAIYSRQVSRRGAELFCELKGERVDIAGGVVKYLEGWIEI